MEIVEVEEGNNDLVVKALLLSTQVTNFWQDSKTTCLLGRHNAAYCAQIAKTWKHYYEV